MKFWNHLLATLGEDVRDPNFGAAQNGKNRQVSCGIRGESDVPEAHISSTGSLSGLMGRYGHADEWKHPL